jgi:hypothetical protein
MKSKHALRNLILIVAIVAVSAVALAGCGKKTDGRKVSLVECDGTITIERGENRITAERGTELRSGDVIVTGESGSAKVQLDDDKFLYIDGPSRVRLTAEGTADSSNTTVFIESGSVLTEVKKKLSDNSTFTVLTANTAMSIRGTKTLTQVLEDAITGHVQTSNAVLEGQVKIKAVKVKADGTVVSVEKDLGAGEGNAFSSNKEELVAQEEMKSIADTGASVNGLKIEIVTEEDAEVVFDVATFEASFLENIKNILVADAQAEAEEDGLTQEQIDAINAKLDEVLEAFDVISTESQNAIDAAAKQDDPSNDTSVDDTPVVAPVTPDDNTAIEPVTKDEKEDDTIDINTDPCANGHDLVHHEGKAATCTDVGFSEYATCRRCNYKTVQEMIQPLGHEYGEWTVTQEPYPEFNSDGYLIAWHAGTKEKACSRCSDKVTETIRLTPVVMSEFEPNLMIPIDFFMDCSEGDPLLKEVLDTFVWLSSPTINGDRTDVEAVLTFAGGDQHVSALNLTAGSTIQVTATVAEPYRDTYVDTVAVITLTEGTMDLED